MYRLYIFCLNKDRDVSVDNSINKHVLAGQKRTHQAHHRQWHPVSGAGGGGNECQVSVWLSVCLILITWSSWSSLILVFTLHSTTYITCPADPKKTLGIKLPFLVMIIKNLKKYFTFEVQVGSWWYFNSCH